MRSVTAYVGLGSNLNDPHGRLCRAVDALSALAEAATLRRSRLYRSAPLGPPGQPDYLNAAVRFETRATPRSLLQSLQALERGQGRERTVRWGPRTLDLDILLYGDMILAEPDLQIPHPRIPERLFVLRPLADLDAALEIPGLGTVGALLRGCPDWPLERIAWERRGSG